MRQASSPYHCRYPHCRNTEFRVECHNPLLPNQIDTDNDTFPLSKHKLRGGYNCFYIPLQKENQKWYDDVTDAVSRLVFRARKDLT